MSISEIPKIESAPESISSQLHEGGITEDNSELDQLKRTISNALYLLIQPLLLNALSIPTTAFIIRKLGATGYGDWAAATALCGVLGALANPGLRTLYIRNVARQRERANILFAEQLGLRMALALFTGMLIVGSAICLRYSIIVVWCVVVAVASLQLTTISGVMVDTLQGLERIKIYSTANFVAGILVTVGTVFAAWRGTGPVGVSIAYLINPVVVIFILIMALVRCGIRPYIRLHLNTCKGLLKESKIIGAGQYLGILQGGLQGVVIPKLLGMTTFGYYTAGTILYSRLTLLPDSLSTAFYPLIARTNAVDLRQSQRQSYRLLTIILIVCAPIAVLLYSLSEPISLILFPHKGALCVLVMRITAWAFPLLAISMPIGYSLQATGYFNATAKIGIYCTIINTVINIIMVIRFGLIGVCIGVIVTTAISLAAILPLYLRHFPGVKTIPLLRTSFCTVGMASVLRWGTNGLHVSIIHTLIISVLSIVTYVCLLFLTDIPRYLHPGISIYRYH